MKIMILVDTYYPLQDGVQMVTQYIAEGLAKKHSVFVVTSLREGLERTTVHNGVRIERIQVKRNPYTLRFAGEKALLDKKIAEYNPDVLMVVCISIWTFDWLKNQLKKYPGKKVLYTHGCSLKEEYSVLGLVKKLRLRRQIAADLMKIHTEWFWGKYKKDLPRYIAEYDKVIYLYDKDALYQHMKNHGTANDIILENAVDDVFFQRKAYLVNPSKELVFINVSSFEERKNQKLILEAFYEADMPNARLILIGSKNTAYYTELVRLNEELLRKHSLQNVHVDILCSLSREDVLKIYQQADVYVAASRWEAMSISLCEAAAAGLTILTTDVGHAAYIPGVFLCEGKEEFTQSMNLVYQNPKLREERGKLSYDYAKDNYRIDGKVKELEQHLLELVNSGK